MKYPILLIVYFFFQESIPFKPSDEFQLNVDLKFKEKPSEYKTNSFSPSGIRLDKVSTTSAPFLNVILTGIKIQPDEVRLIAIDSGGKTILKRTLPLHKDLIFEMGFVDDLKRKDTPNELTIYFLSQAKLKLRKIVFAIQDDGTFQVNGNWRGKF